MSKVIYKYNLDNSLGISEVKLPKGALVTSCLLQNGKDLVIYSLVDNINDLKNVESRYFRVYSTGQTVNDNIKEHIGTFVVDDYLVFHLYEIHNDKTDILDKVDEEALVSECTVSNDSVINPVFDLKSGCILADI